MSADIQKKVNTLMLELRNMVVDVQREHRYLKGKFKELPPLTTPPTSYTTNSSNTVTASSAGEPSATTLSTGTISSATGTTNSARPPPYKSIVNIPNPPPPPQAPIRTKRGTLSNRITLSSMSSNAIKRGALIVLEGLDRVGKSTLAQKLVEHLEKIRRPVAHLRFPDRSTPIGQMINDFLKNGSKRVDDHAMHLLFSANRWELNKRIRQTINHGTTVIVDRYSYSGIAYSCAHRNLSSDWCRKTEEGLPQPDLVIYLELPKEAQLRRPGFGDERYETQELQDLVRREYEELIHNSNENWLRIDVENKSPDQILGEVIIPVKRCLEACSNKGVDNLKF